MLVLKLNKWIQPMIWRRQKMKRNLSSVRKISWDASHLFYGSILKPSVYRICYVRDGTSYSYPSSHGSLVIETETLKFLFIWPDKIFIKSLLTSKHCSIHPFLERQLWGSKSSECLLTTREVSPEFILATLFTQMPLKIFSSSLHGWYHSLIGIPL